MQSTGADLIVYNARIITFDDDNPMAEALTIKGNKIWEVGPKSLFDSAKGPQTQFIDCQGMTVVPGFNDAHCHPLAQAITMLHIDCSPFAVKDIAGIKEQIRTRALEIPKGRWLRAAQYNELTLAEKKHPTCWDLDEAAPDNPVVLIHYTSGICVLNSRALNLLDITDKEDGIISGPDNRVQQGLPQPKEEELLTGIRVAARQSLSYGITSLQDTGWNNTLGHWAAYQRYKDIEGLLPQRISMMVGFESQEEFAGYGLFTGSGNSKLRIGGVKLALDESSGCPHPPQQEINKQALQAHGLGYQLAFHVHDQHDLWSAATALEVIRGKSPKGCYRPPLINAFVSLPYYFAVNYGHHDFNFFNLLMFHHGRVVV